jgi:hypothetical protein
MIDHLCVVEEQAPNTRTILSYVFQWLQQRHCLITLMLQKYAATLYVVHVTAQGVSLEAFFRKLMIPRYWQIADSLSPVNSREILKNSVL